MAVSRLTLVGLRPSDSIELAIAPIILDSSSGETRRTTERRAVDEILTALLEMEARDHTAEAKAPIYTYEPSGRPYLSNHPDRSLSISHTEGYAVCALGDKPLGIDIERRGKQIMRVIPRFLHQEEQSLVQHHAQDELIAHLLWSAKEAAYKLINPPSASLLDCILWQHSFHELADEGTFYLHSEEARGVIRIDYLCQPDYVMTLARYNAEEQDK